MNARAGTRRIMAVAAASLLIGATTYLSLNFSLAPLGIVGIPGALGFLLWYYTGLKKPLDPAVVLPPFILTSAGFTLNSVEEYLGHYGPAVGRLFGFAWTDQAFVIIVLVLIAALSLVSLGLYYGNAMAGFVAIVFLTTRIAEISLFVFPLWPPKIQPDVAGQISEVVAGTLVRDMPNHYIHVAGGYYFPGMFTVALAVIPAAYALYRIWSDRPSHDDVDVAQAVK